MGNEDLSAVLFEKFSAEQEKYREWLLSQPPEEILNHTYENTVRQDILCAVENGDITDKIAAALLRKDVPLSEVYERFRDTETDYTIRLELPELREMVSLLRRSSNNPNQIARRANETGRIYETDIADVKDTLERAWDSAQSILFSLSKLTM